MAKKRIHLLPEAEVNELYTLPLFNQEERVLYFSLNTKEISLVRHYTHSKTQLYCILQIGYFKAKHQFFSFSLDDVTDDADYINHQKFNGKTPTTGKITREYIKNQREAILGLYQYQFLSEKNSVFINQHLSTLLKIHPSPRNALRQLLIYFDQHNIILPTYRTLQDLFSQAYRIEQNRLDYVIACLPSSIKTDLESLIKNDDGLTELNTLRSDQKNFQYTAVKNEVEKANKISELYQFSQSFIPSLGISKNAVCYYADITDYYSSSRLRRLTQSNQHLHLICYLHQRYHQIIDNLITNFMYHVRSLQAASKGYAETKQTEYNATLTVDFPKLAEFLQWFPAQKDRPDVVYQLFSQEAYNILPEDQFISLAQIISGKLFDKKAAEWEFYEKSARSIALYLRPIMLTVNFEYYLEGHPILAMIKALKEHYAAKRTPKSFDPARFSGFSIPKSIKKYLYKSEDKNTIDPHRFEFYVYSKMYHHIDRGRLFCNDSVSYGDLECDLVSENFVDQAKEMTHQFGYPHIPHFCGDLLDTMLNQLDKAWDRTTNSIKDRSNTGININVGKNATDWTLSYDTSKKKQDLFFTDLPKVEMPNLIKYMGDAANIWEKFLHKKYKYVKKESASAIVLNACILAEAFGISLEHMANICDISYNTLRSTREDFFTVSALCDANDVIANYVYSLPIFHSWNLIEDHLLADADGQKIQSTDQTIQSRYSTKFFGKGKGISIYTLLANHVAVNATNIGPNEFEGHCLYDMIYSNKTELNIDMITGDNHSLSQYNFVFLKAIDVDYVPSIKDIKKAAGDLYSVKDPSHYEGIITPKAQIKLDRIKNEKRSILRVLLSLLMQENTQTTIIKKLTSHARYSRLREGLLEYNKILKTTHVLNLIHDVSLRKALKTARNRTESYHSLQGLIRKTYNGIFKGKKIESNQISAHSTRLVANCIIAYNSIILNSIYLNLLKSGVSNTILKEFSRVSPIAWAHLVFTGRYSFTKSDGQIDINRFVKLLEEIWSERLGVKEKTPEVVKK